VYWGAGRSSPVTQDSPLYALSIISPGETFGFRTILFYHWAVSRFYFDAVFNGAGALSLTLPIGKEKGRMLHAKHGSIIFVYLLTA
jgi:hypothetical protein